jgi:hypothetical protein
MCDHGIVRLDPDLGVIGWLVAGRGGPRVLVVSL